MKRLSSVNIVSGVTPLHFKVVTEKHVTHIMTVINKYKGWIHLVKKYARGFDTFEVMIFLMKNAGY